MEKHKQDGNKLFTEKCYFEALDAYNKGLGLVSTTQIDYLKQKTKELLRDGSNSSALICAAAIHRLQPEDVEALLLYAECLVHFDGLRENALLVCLQALVDSDDSGSEAALKTLETCVKFEASKTVTKKDSLDKKRNEDDLSGISDSQLSGDNGEASADNNNTSSSSSPSSAPTSSPSQPSQNEALLTSSSPSTVSPFPPLSPNSTSLFQESHSTSSRNSFASFMTHVWETSVSLADCLSDLSSVSASMPDAEKEGSCIGTILANVAASELALRQPYLAAASAAAALVFLTNNSIKTKAAFRLTTALIQSCSFAQGSESLLLLSSLQIDAKDVTRLRNLMAQRQRETRDGDYDWESHIQWTKDNPGQDLDCASFVGPVEISEIPLKGCGLKASRDIKQGELVLVNHAYFACHRSNITHLMKGVFERVAADRMNQFEDSKTLFFLTDGVHDRDLRPSSPFHVLAIPRFPLPFLHHQFLQLQHADSFDDFVTSSMAGDEKGIMENVSKMLKRTKEKLPTIPSQFKTNEEKMKFGEKLVGIINTNMMHHAQASCPWHVLESQEDSALSRYSTDGLWVLPSFLNTGSKTNIVAICIGDVLVCKAAKHIKKGDELLISYTIEREWSKREEFMDHHGIPMPPDPESPLKGKLDQVKKIESKLEEISNLMRQSRHADALKALNNLEKKQKEIITQDLIYADILFKKAKCRSLTGNSPSQVLPMLLSALDAERKFRPYGSDYICLVLQWTRFPNLKAEEKAKLKQLLDDLALFTYGIPHDKIATILDNSWN